MLVLAQNTTASSAGILAERLRQHVEADQLVLSSNSSQRQEVRVTVSIGVAGLGQEVTDSLSLIQRADEALYRAKQEGRNRVIIYDVNMPKATASAM